MKTDNLVVAAAGSGKTSVIVAKAGWLIRKQYRRSIRAAATGIRERRPERNGRKSSRNASATGWEPRSPSEPSIA